MNKMNTFKVTFADGNTLTTGMNATLEDAKAYYIGHSFQFGDTDAKPYDHLVKAVNVELLPTLEQVNAGWLAIIEREMKAAGVRRRAAEEF
jgi:hypothetical protein